MARRYLLVISIVVLAFAGIDARYELTRAEPVVKATAPPVPVRPQQLHQGRTIRSAYPGSAVQASVTIIRPRVAAEFEQVSFKGEHFSASLLRSRPVTLASMLRG
jgi:hypothetical protein